MPHPIHQKLAGFKTKVLTRADGAPFELAEICETLLELIEQNRNDLTEAFEAQVRVDQRGRPCWTPPDIGAYQASSGDPATTRSAASTRAAASTRSAATTRTARD